MKPLKLAIIVTALTIAGPATAGPYADALGKRLVSSTTKEDKALFVRWMFVAMSLHPDLKGLSSITPKQREDTNREVGQLMTRLLTVTCAAEAKEAVRYEGANAITSAFNLLGQIAGRELFSSSEVRKGLADLEKHYDSEEIRKMLEED